MRTLSMMGHVFLKGQACAEQRLRGKHEMDTDSINLYPLYLHSAPPFRLLILWGKPRKVSRSFLYENKLVSLRSS